MAHLETRQAGLLRNKRWLVRDVDLRLSPGEFWALLGPNGAGKSTLLRLLSGELHPDAGQVLLDGQEITQLDNSRLARRRALLTQRREAAASGFPFTVREIVQLGRHPHAGRETPAQADQVVQASMERTSCWSLADRIYATLSGGEAARVDLARALAQDAEILFLDEPTNHLDPAHQVEVARLGRDLAREGRTVVAALHDLNLAAAFADRLLILRNGRPVTQGPPAETLTSELLAEVFGIPFEIMQGPDGRLRVFPALSSDRSPFHGQAAPVAVSTS